MKYKIFKIILASTIIILMLAASCEKDKPDLPYNPLNGKTTAVFNPDKSYGTVADIDGNIYKTIKIGNQIWMAENLRVTHYQTGEDLPEVKDTAAWTNLTSGAYCNYNNTNNLDTIATYGRLYNWYAASDSSNLAPKGWHVASAVDWNILIEYLGGDSIASNKMKEVGNSHWEDPFESDNSSGFTALPGGWRYKAKDFSFMGYYSVWWTSTNNTESSAPFLYLFFVESKVWKGFNYKENGYSIRCIKD